MLPRDTERVLGQHPESLGLKVERSTDLSVVAAGCG
jgi:hypothetical protein